MSLARNLSKLAQFLNGSGLLTSLGLAPDAVQVGMKNRIINGAMMIDQRNAGASVTPTNGQFLTDRFFAGLTAASKYTAQQNAGSVTPPVGFTKYLGVTSSSSYSVAAGDAFFLVQRIEGVNTADFAWGTASASTVTLSFRVYSSLTGTFSGALQNFDGTRNYPFTYSVPVANTWTTVSITIAGDTTGTWKTDTTYYGVAVIWSLGVGSTYGGAAAGSWTATNSYGVSSSVSVVGTSGATFYITGVQLEKGSTATSFDYRPYGTELALCQRYLPVVNGLYSGQAVGVASALITFPFTVPARVSPTGMSTSAAASAYFLSNAGLSYSACSSLSFFNSGETAGSVSFQLGTSPLVAGNATTALLNSGAKIFFTGCEL